MRTATSPTRPAITAKRPLLPFGAGDVTQPPPPVVEPAPALDVPVTGAAAEGGPEPTTLQLL